MNSVRIIIVDDDPAIREILRSLAEDLGAEVLAEADNGRGAIEQTERHHPELLLLDISMPVMGGFRAAKYLRQHVPQTSIIFISQYRQKVYVEEALEIGARGYIVKGSLLSELGPAIDAVMHGGTFVSAGINGSIRMGPDWDERFMRAALALAKQAEAEGEVPVGAVLIVNGEIVGQGRNRPIAAYDPTCHAEIEALRQASARLRNYRLPGTTLYVTLEPCVMCAGAIVLARVERLVFAARDLRFGAVRSKFGLADSDLLNHCVRIEEGLLAVEAGELLSRFFAVRRSEP